MVWKGFNFKKGKSLKPLRKDFKVNSIIRWDRTLESFPIFNSIWFQRLINSLILGGKKVKTTKWVLKGLVGLKSIYGYSPILLFFESLEVARFPLKITTKKKGRRVNIWLDLVPWWRQYKTTLTIFRKLLHTKSSKKAGFLKNFISELVFLKEIPHKSNLFKKKLSLGQVASEARMGGHYRWKR